MSQRNILLKAGSSAPVTLGRPDKQAVGVKFLDPGVICNVSSGAVLTYQVEVTGDDNPSDSAAVWNVFDGMGGLAASANGTLGGLVTAIRVTITSWTSGALTFYVVQ